MSRDSEKTITHMKVDGGMTGNAILMQFQSDILGIPVTRSKIRETTALGAAYAAGLAVGFWSDWTELRRHWQQDHTWQPAMSKEERDKRIAGWHKALERSLGWV